MRKTSLLMMALSVAVAFSGSAFAQAAAQPGNSKIGCINTAEFTDEKTGATRYVNAIKAIDAEMKPRVTELETLQARLKAISDDIVNLQKAGSAIVNEKAIAAKQEEFEALKRQFDFKKQDYEAAYDKRRNEILRPISTDIMKAVQEYAKQNGYTAIFDTVMLAQTRVILAIDPIADITKEFITYYNGRSAATATTSVPK